MTLQGIRILIVEDEVLVAMAAEAMVEDLGAVVAGTARSVAAATGKIREPGFDCVMLDVNLNGNQSFDVAAELQDRAIPFVFCTAYTHAFERFEQVPRITKPYCQHELGKGLEAALAQKSGRLRH